jgi:hypothetical protein
MVGGHGVDQPPKFGQLGLAQRLDASVYGCAGFGQHIGQELHGDWPIARRFRFCRGRLANVQLRGHEVQHAGQAVTAGSRCVQLRRELTRRTQGLHGIAK